MTALADGPRTAPAARIWGPELRMLSIGLVSTITLVAFESLAVLTVAPAMSADLRGLNLYGWVTGAFFLTTVVGAVLAGAAMDRTGAARPLLGGLLAFGLGLAVAATAVSMPVVIVGRGLQGLGAGAMTSINMALIGRMYPAEVRPKMFAVISTAWVVPSLGGPAVAAVVAEQAGWRWVFGGLIPLVVLAGGVTVYAMRVAAGRLGMGPTETDAVRPADGLTGPARPAAVADIWPPEETGRTPLLRAVLVAVGAGLVLAGLTSRSLLGIPLVAAGLLGGLGPLRRLLPTGALRASPGAPAAVVSRGLIAFVYFGAEAFLPLTITSHRHSTTGVAGIGVTAAAIIWTCGSWTQARLAARHSARFLVTAGMSLMVVGIAGAGVTLLDSAVPLPVGIALWSVAAYGIGISYSPCMNVALNAAPPDRQGAASGSVSLADNLGTAFGTGLGGVAVAAASSAGQGGHVDSAVQAASPAGLAAAFTLSVAVGLTGVAVARRLPATRLAAEQPAAPGISVAD
ncbi:MFS transporter [Pseudofrankia sp. DC12]|uniref:MFS transporter n=1 Tax=Pseudofrankia sp. DC12 TaxID=683315 RepID=UPI0005F7AB38|nr:MFS transporter [Pseudofrankia sp. DC12]